KKHIVIPEFFRKRNLRNWVSVGILLFVYYIFNEQFRQLASLITHSSFSTEDLITLFFTYDFTIFHILIYSLNIFSIFLITDILVFLGKILTPKTTINLNIQLIA